MQRVTITLDDDIMADIDRLMAVRGYQNRSEAIRDLARVGLKEAALDVDAGSECVAALVYVYDHSARELSKRLVRSFHDHHDLSMATMHVHLDHDNCMEVTVLKGETKEVRNMAEHVIAERGVRHGKLTIVPVALETETHAHGGAGSRKHEHVRVGAKKGSLEPI
jgi:CopG family nickel-responsive transcriptional regulator